MTPETQTAVTFRCGTAALVGRPNVGKSTLLNALIGWRLSIVSPKAQTTRHRILGILTDENSQILFLDTPGLHKPRDRAINRQLNKAARQGIAEANVVVQVIEVGRWNSEDQAVYDAVSAQEHPRLLVVNKVDAQKDKKVLLYRFLTASIQNTASKISISSPHNAKMACRNCSRRFVVTFLKRRGCSWTTKSRIAASVSWLPS